MTHTRGLLLLIGTNLIWGTTYVVAKVALETIPPALLVSLRFTLATALLWGILWWRRRGRQANEPDLLAMAPADLRRTLGMGLYGIALGYLLGYLGVNLTTATDAALMIIGEVIFTAILAAMIAGERIGRWRRLGIGLGVLGVVVLVLSNAADTNGDNRGLLRAAGDLLVLSGIFCEAIYTVVGAGLARRYHPLTMIAYAYAGSLLLWLPLLAWYIFSGHFPTVNLSAGLGVVYLAVFPSVVCVITWFSVLRTTGASLGAISLFVQPVVGALLGTWLLGDPITGGLLVGGVLIFSALYLTTLPDRPQPIVSVAPALPPAQT